MWGQKARFTKINRLLFLTRLFGPDFRVVFRWAGLLGERFRKLWLSDPTYFGIIYNGTTPLLEASYTERRIQQKG